MEAASITVMKWKPFDSVPVTGTFQIGSDGRWWPVAGSFVQPLTFEEILHIEAGGALLVASHGRQTDSRAASSVIVGSTPGAGLPAESGIPVIVEGTGWFELKTGSKSRWVRITPKIWTGEKLAWSGNHGSELFSA